jgi:SAM-dependent methyltransferase
MFGCVDCVFVLSLINKILFWVLATLLVVDAYFLFCHGGIPNIRTAPAIRRKIIDLLKQDFETRKLAGYTIVDVGSGNGLFTREIARVLPQAKVIGIEIAWQSVAWSNFWKRRAKLSNLEYKKMSFLDYDFSEADAVVMYLLPNFMIQLGKKLHEEARPSTFITSNKFRLGDGWQPADSLRIKTRYLHQGALHIYRKT